MSFTGIGANASSGDVEANEAAIAALQTSISAKPSVSEVDAQIDQKNADQNLQINL